MKNDKYKFTGETKDWFGATLHQIKALGKTIKIIE
jgi:hypothetical protein